MREFEEKAFDQWLAQSYQRHWHDANQKGWIGARSTDEAAGSYMLLARLQLQEGITAVYGEFKPAESTLVHLDTDELLLTFFIDGGIQGYNANLMDATSIDVAQPALPFGAPSVLLRRPHPKQGSSVIIPAQTVSRFLQLRMRQQSYLDWLARLDMPVTQRILDAWLGDQGAVVFSGQWSPDIRMALQPWRSITAMRVAMLPFLAAKAMQLLTLFSLDFHARGSNARVDMRAQPHTLLIHVRRLIEQDMSCRPSLAELALNVGVSVSSLKRMHAAQYGESLMQYGLKLRLAHAKHLVEHTSLTLSTIAEATGFSNLGRFAKAYQMHAGHKPVLVRQEILRRQQVGNKAMG
jgi:AraC-like DNA-binding protein